jgi:hypothetical protein
MSKLLQGMGVWIWQINKCENGDLDAIIDRASSVGLTHVLIKVGDGFSMGYNSRSGRTELIEGLHCKGIQPIVWHYARGLNGEDEADRFADVAARFPGTVFVADMEVEFKDGNWQAYRYLSQLEQWKKPISEATDVPRLILAVSSYYLPNNHSTFPWDRVREYADIYMPQVYWYKRDPVWALEESLRQTESLGIPRFVTGQAYLTPSGNGTAGEMEQFVRAVLRKNLWGANFWSWQHMTEDHWDVLKRVWDGEITG